MIKNPRLNPLLCGFIPLFNYKKSNDPDVFDIGKLWPDYIKCSQEKLLQANKVSSSEYNKLKIYCADSLQKFEIKRKNEIKLQLKKSTMSDIYKLNDKLPNEQDVYTIIENELDKIFISNNISEFKKIITFISCNGINSKIKYDFEKFLKINNLNDWCLYYEILSDIRNITQIDKDHFANLLKRDMESKCKNNKKISIEEYKTESPILCKIVEMVFCEVGKKNIRYCDLKEIEILLPSLVKQKVEQLFIDALLEDDIITMIDLINKHFDKINLSVVAKKLTNRYVIDYLLTEIIKYDLHRTFTIGESCKIHTADYYKGSAHEAIALLLFMSCNYENNVLTDYMINFKPLRESEFFTRDYHTYYCKQIIKDLYQNDSYESFVKYSNMLRAFPNYKHYFTQISVIYGNGFEQKNNYLELIGTHVIVPPVTKQTMTQAQTKNKNTNQKSKIHNKKSNGGSSCRERI